jgi:hypothetical protein
MSKDFLTLKDAANRLGSSSSTNMNFIHKDEAILSEPILLHLVVIVYMIFQQMMI